MKWESEGEENTDEGTGTLFCPSLCIILFLLFCFSASQVSSAPYPPPPVQTGTGLPLNAFSWTRPAPAIVRVTAVNNAAGTLFGHSRGPQHRATTGATAVEWAAPMHTAVEVVMLSSLRGVPAAIDEAAMRSGAGPVPCD